VEERKRSSVGLVALIGEKPEEKERPVAEIVLGVS